jgi:hypothetical protein
MEEQFEAAQQKLVGRESNNLAVEVRSTARRAHSPSRDREPKIMKKNALTRLKQGRIGVSGSKPRRSYAW